MPQSLCLWGAGHESAKAGLGAECLDVGLSPAPSVPNLPTSQVSK